MTAYRPTNSGVGVNSVANQQRRVLREANDDQSPSRAFLEDLAKAITAWHEAGSQVVVGLDANTDVTGLEMTQWAANLGLREVIAERHGDLPPTYDSGSRPVDGIFASHSIRQTRCGYLGFGVGCESHHRILWLEILEADALGTNLPPAKQVRVRRLRIQDPLTVYRYCTKLLRWMLQHDIQNRLCKLMDGATTPFGPDQIKELETIDTIRTQGMITAEAGCRKLRMGAILWSPSFATAMTNKKYITLLVRRQQGRRVSSTLLRRLCAKATMILSGPLSTLKLQPLLKTAQDALSVARKSAERDWDTFLVQLAEANKAAGRTSAGLALLALRHRKQQRRQWATLRRVFKNPRKEVTIVSTPSESGAWTEYHTRLEVEKACLKESERRFCQTEHLPCVSPNVITMVGTQGNGLWATDILTGSDTIPTNNIGAGTIELFRALHRRTDIKERATDCMISTE